MVTSAGGGRAGRAAAGPEAHHATAGGAAAGGPGVGAERARGGAGAGGARGGRDPPRPRQAGGRAAPGAPLCEHLNKPVRHFFIFKISLLNEIVCIYESFEIHYGNIAHLYLYYLSNKALCAARRTVAVPPQSHPTPVPAPAPASGPGPARTSSASHMLCSGVQRIGLSVHDIPVVLAPSLRRLCCAGDEDP